MTQRLSTLVVWGCNLVLAGSVMGALYLLIDIDAFATLGQQNISLAIYWDSVGTGQWYGVWLLTAAYVALGLVALYFLRRAFSKFAQGQFFTRANSEDLRKFSTLLVAQVIATPVHFGFISLILSLNHPAGKKMLAITFGSQELKSLFLAVILWVLSDMLVKGAELENENKQFI